MIKVTLSRRLFLLIWLGRWRVHLIRRGRICLKPVSHRTPTWVAFYSPLRFLGATFNGMLLFPLKSWSAEDRVILGCSPRHFGLSPFVLGKYPPQHGPRALIKRGLDHKFPGPTIAPQNPAIRLLGQIGGFWWHRISVNAYQSLLPIGSRDFSSARDTSLEPLEGETWPY